MNIRSALRWLAAALILASSLARAEPGVTAHSIKIGMFAPMTGGAAIFGEFTVGALAYYRMINAEGGVHGRSIQVDLVDSACNPETTVAAVRKLVDQDKVFALHAGVCTADVMAVKKSLLQQGIPFMNLGAAGASLTDPLAANLFSALPNTNVVGRTLVDFAMSRPGTRRVAVISHPDDWGKSQLATALERLRSKYHLDFVANVTMERGTTDITPQILTLRQAHPDVVLAFLYPADTAIFVRAAHEYGLDTPMLGSFGALYEDTVKRVGDPAATRKLFIFHALRAPATSPQLQRWADVIRKYGPANAPINDYSLSGMAGAQAVVEALKRAGPQPTRKAFIHELDSLRDYDPGLLAGPISFTSTDHAGVKQGAMLTTLDGHVVSVQSWPAQER